MIGIAITWSDLEKKITLKHKLWNREQWGLCGYSGGCFLPNNSGGCALGTVWVALLASYLLYLHRPKGWRGRGRVSDSLSCIVGLLPPQKSVSAKGVKREKEGLCSLVKRERQRAIALCYFIFCLVYNGYKSSTILIGATKLKNQNYVLNIIFFF